MKPITASMFRPQEQPIMDFPTVGGGGGGGGGFSRAYGEVPTIFYTSRTHSQLSQVFIYLSIYIYMCVLVF